MMVCGPGFAGRTKWPTKEAPAATVTVSPGFALFKAVCKLLPAATGISTANTGIVQDAASSNRVFTFISFYFLEPGAERIGINSAPVIYKAGNNYRLLS